VKIEEKFNNRSATLVDVNRPQVQQSTGYALGIRITLWPSEIGDSRHMFMHLTPSDALLLARDLIAQATTRLEAEKKL
jgi:hypothetical protein